MAAINRRSFVKYTLGTCSLLFTHCSKKNEIEMMPYDDVCEKVWVSLCDVFFREIEIKYKEINIPLSKTKSNTIYQHIISRTPYIGGIENPLYVSLVMSILSMAIYQTVKEKIPVKNFGEIMNGLIAQSKELKELFAKRELFTETYQQRLKIEAEKSQEKEYPFNWVYRYDRGKTIDEFKVTFTACAICKLAEREGCSEIVSQFCETDSIIAAYSGAELIRTKTLANGDKMCDFHFKKRP